MDDGFIDLCHIPTLPHCEIFPPCVNMTGGNLLGGHDQIDDDFYHDHDDENDDDDDQKDTWSTRL